MALSTLTAALGTRPAVLSTMRKVSSSPTRGIVAQSTEVTRASGGGASLSSRHSSATSAFALDLDEHAGGVVQHEPDEPERHRLAKYEGAKADPLHGAGDPDAPALGELTQLGRNPS